MAQLIVAFVTGAIFAIGLVVADMTNPQRIIDFLDVAGAWDPTLLGVVGGAVITAAIGNFFARRRGQPMFAPAFAVPMKELIDRRLLLGAALFGIGWGMAGYCPAPAITGSGFMNGATWIFLISMMAGMAIFSWRFDRLSR